MPYLDLAQAEPFDNPSYSICNPAPWGPLEPTFDFCRPFHTLVHPCSNIEPNFTIVKLLSITGSIFKEIYG